MEDENQCEHPDCQEPVDPERFCSEHHDPRCMAAQPWTGGMRDMGDYCTCDVWEQQ